MINKEGERRGIYLLSLQCFHEEILQEDYLICNLETMQPLLHAPHRVPVHLPDRHRRGS
jgi:hypothetical protein